ncbi:hypothetical protein CLV68_4441 [Actinokineospora cianjurensis]|uniref:Uncharacterized protein n=1 Tax=Actinokineospora cianjurensis TaxID=585224 RepID=A0A421B245_9PSEU|nr:hypothetical protein CLV68_4441 [Actinokineospora cianjurensis]
MDLVVAEAREQVGEPVGQVVVGLQGAGLDRVAEFRR